MEEIKKRINKAMQIQDKNDRKNEVKKIILDLKKKLNNESRRLKENQVYNMDLDLVTKAKFFMVASECEHEADIYCINEVAGFFDIGFWVITVIDDPISMEFNEEFVDLLKTNRALQEEYTVYFKSIGFESVNSYINNLEDLFELPCFKNSVLTDEIFIEDIQNKLFSPASKQYFFSVIPNEYSYLILLFDDEKGRLKDLLKELFNLHFGNQLTKENIDEIIELRERILSKSNPRELNRGYRVRKLKNVLRNVLKDERFYSDMKKIQSIANLELEVIVNFTYKYYGTGLWNDLLCENEQVSDEMHEKIKYLANSEKKEDTEQITLKKLENMTENDLKNMKKQENIEREAVKSDVQGGPVANTLNHFMPDCDETECRRINYDGTVDKVGYCYTFGTHLPGLKKIYGIDFVGKKSLPMEIAEKAIEEFSSITWTIEFEKSYIYSLDSPSKEQKKVSIEWLKTADKASKVVFLVYDSKQNKWTIPTEEDERQDEDGFVSPNVSIEYILEMGERVTEEELENLVINDEIMLDPKDSIK